MAIYFRDYFLDWFKNPKKFIKLYYKGIESDAWEGVREMAERKLNNERK